MGGVMTVDPWLGKLGDRGLLEAKAALSLANLQARMSDELGHVLALNDEYVRRKICEYAPSGETPPIRIRCLRCLGVLSLADWTSCYYMNATTRELKSGVLYLAGHRLAARCLKPCEGSAKAVSLVESLRRKVSE